VDIYHQKECRRAGGMHEAQQPAVVHVAHNVLDGVKRQRDVRLVVHRQKDARDHLQHQHETGQKTEIPPIAEITRGRITG